MWRNKSFPSSTLILALIVLTVGTLASSPNVHAQNDSNGVKFIAPRFNPPTPPEDSAIDSIQVPDDVLATEETSRELSQEELPLETKTEATVTQENQESSESSSKEYDVYKENGHYFVDWEKPQIAIVFTGMTNGYIEPCGCAGMERMKGGLSRRSTFLKELRTERGWDVVTIDAGQITVGFGVQEELKFDMATNAFNLMDYDAIGIGKGELRFPAYFLLTFTAPTSSTNASLYTSANIGVYGYHPTYTLPYKVIEKGGKRVGVVSVICGDETTERRDENILLEKPEKKLIELMPSFKKEKCDSWVLIVHGTEEETVKLAKQFPIFDYIVSSDTPAEPPAEMRSLGKGQSMIEVGEKGKYAIVLGLFHDGSIRYQRVALDSRYDSSHEITLLMKDYQAILKNLIASKGYRNGLGVNPARSPQAEVLGKYVGSQKCRSCHEEAYRTWAKSRHAVAWNSLKETANPPRDFDPECISCHVVGWDSLHHFPYIDGYSSEKKTPELLNVGCESCHGPGEHHMSAEIGDNETLQEKIRKAMRLGANVEKVCIQCHDGDNSPSFDFDKYYPLVDHSEEIDE